MQALGSFFACPPELFFRPIQILRLCRRVRERSPNEFEEVVLPWRHKIKVRPDEYIGSCIWTMGLYDLCLCESIWKLLDPGEFAVDVGANIGQMTSVMAARVGRSGKVFAFEPHPEIYEELLANINLWVETPNLAKISPHQVALSAQADKGCLYIPESKIWGAGFGTNRAIASLDLDSDKTSAEPKNYVVVQLERLDQLLEDNQYIGLLKIDVEGHELAVLKGAVKLINKNQIRDIIFEEHANDPHATLVTNFLEEHGYTLFYLIKEFWGLDAGSLKEGRAKYSNKVYYNCLATKEPERALTRLKKRGWAVLGVAF
ncbi:FkbM family methyltransferase [Tolypothrix sp. VBCCA 56010]|uniref:FkbM family methyltransferase n=1 Tax=Tolypothrix sp. VBCCA 56010 TaxID=3137731 RepID=UPI003D7D03B4